MKNATRSWIRYFLGMCALFFLGLSPISGVQAATPFDEPSGGLEPASAGSHALIHLRTLLTSNEPGHHYFFSIEQE